MDNDMNYKCHMSPPASLQARLSTISRFFLRCSALPGSITADKTYFLRAIQDITTARCENASIIPYIS